MNATPQKRSSPQEVLILAAIKLAMVNAAIATAKVREIREARAKLETLNARWT